jgi:N-acetyl-gamma-glutamyl-phosphate reductase
LIKVGIIGSTGYTGAELVRFLSRHPQVKLVAVTSQSYIGKELTEVYPHLNRYSELICEEQDIPKLAKECDVIFTALPHGLSMDVVAEAAARGKKVIDLGADFRFDNQEIYEEWYKVNHTVPKLLKEAVYGLPEIHKKKIIKANIIGNPGCYPTSIILGMAPLLKNKLIEIDTIIADSKSGVSGAGRGLNLGAHYAECNDSIKAYNIGVHRHTPEIEQELGKLAENELRINFTPHLTPMTRGILSTVYSKLKTDISTEQLIEVYREFYEEKFFVRILPKGVLPQTKWVYGSNFCDIGLAVDPRTGRVIVCSAIDNLVKGASGQAIQNMNLIFGLPENTGIDQAPLFP